MSYRTELTIKRLFEKFDLDIRRLPKHEKNKYGWLRQFDIHTVLDIGANVGQFVDEIERFLPDAYIFSFEPLKNAYVDLSKRQLRRSNFKAYNMGFGDSNGNHIINNYAYSLSSSFLQMAQVHKDAYPGSADSKAEVVIMRRLDDFINEERIDLKPNILLKIDVQGYEDRVLRHGLETLKKSSVVIIEVSYQVLYEGQLLFDELYAFFKNEGFHFKGTLGTGYHPTTGSPLFADAIFTR